MIENVAPADLLSVIGELEVTRRMQDHQLKEQAQRIEELEKLLVVLQGGGEEPLAQ